MFSAVLAVELRAWLLAGRTRTREFVEVFEEVRLVGREIPALGPADDGAVRVDEVDASVDERRDVSRRCNAGQIERGVRGNASRTVVTASTNADACPT